MPGRSRLFVGILSLERTLSVRELVTLGLTVGDIGAAERIHADLLRLTVALLGALILDLHIDLVLEVERNVSFTLRESREGTSGCLGLVDGLAVDEQDSVRLGARRDGTINS